MNKYKPSDIAEKRKYIISAYPNSERWRLRCQSMSPQQIFAVYHSIKNREIANKKRLAAEEAAKRQYTQLTLYDIYGDIKEKENDLCL